MYDLEVAHPKHNFLLPNGVVTSNSHEQELGHKGAKQASNQAASHRPVFEEVRRLVDDPIEGKKVVPARTTPIPASPPPTTQRFPLKKYESEPGGPLLHPIHAAYLMRDWVNQLGPAHASLKFFTHIVPLLMPEHHASMPQLEVPQFVRKLEALEIDLKKAAIALKTPAETPSSKATALPNTNVIDANVHGLPHLNTSPEQHALIHGMDVSRTYAAPSHTDALSDTPVTNPKWMKNAAGKMVLVKSGQNPQFDMNYARKEVAYHNIARDFFGMGKYVPTTAIFRAPSGHEYSAQEAVEHAEHAQPFTAANATQAAHLLEHHDNGELDKLRIMNTVLGNQDRHHGNFLFTNHSEPALRMIDHGHAFEGWGGNDMPMYAEMAQREDIFRHHGNSNSESAPLHPAAAAWLSGLKPDDLYQHLDQHGFDQRRKQLATGTLRALQAHAASGLPRHQVFDMLPSSRNDDDE